MVALNESDVRLTMRKQLKTIPDLPEISYENHAFTPPSFSEDEVGPTLWIEERQNILGEPQTSIGYLEIMGETIYSVYTPKGQGTRAADDLTKLIMEAFQPTQSLIGTTETVILEKTTRQPYRENMDHSVWSFKSVIIGWRAFTKVTP